MRLFLPRLMRDFLLGVKKGFVSILCYMIYSKYHLKLITTVPNVQIFPRSNSE